MKELDIEYEPQLNVGRLNSKNLDKLGFHTDAQFSLLGGWILDLSRILVLANPFGTTICTYA